MALAIILPRVVRGSLKVFAIRLLSCSRCRWRLQVPCSRYGRTIKRWTFSVRSVSSCWLAWFTRTASWSLNSPTRKKRARHESARCRDGCNRAGSALFWWPAFQPYWGFCPLRSHWVRALVACLWAWLLLADVRHTAHTVCNPSHFILISSKHVPQAAWFSFHAIFYLSIFFALLAIGAHAKQQQLSLVNADYSIGLQNNFDAQIQTLEVEQAKLMNNWGQTGRLLPTINNYQRQPATFTVSPQNRLLLGKSLQ